MTIPRIAPYIEEIKKQIISANTAIEKDGYAFDNYHHFLIHSAIIYKILFPYVNEKNISNGDEGELFRKKRGEFVREYFLNQDFIENEQVKKFRNHFEHTDERLDEAVKGGFIIDGNVVTNSKLSDHIDMKEIGRKSLLRNYEDGRLSINGEEFDIDGVKLWLKKISDHINLKGVPKDNVGGYLHNYFVG